MVVPLLADARGCLATYDQDASLIRVRWQMASANLHLAANLSNTSVVLKNPIEGQAFFSSDSLANNSIGPWGVVWSLS
jgi:1,4-alpha-glucan branching enzyme/maltooligosyltrehalose trehalohydrolase